MSDFPKWVTPHDSHVVRTEEQVVKSVDPATGYVRETVAPAHVSLPGWDEFHVARDGGVTVLVNDADEEAKALAAASPPATEDHDDGKETDEADKKDDPASP